MPQILQYDLKYINKQNKSYKYNVYKHNDELNFRGRQLNYSGSAWRYCDICDQLSSARRNTNLLSQSRNNIFAVNVKPGNYMMENMGQRSWYSGD